MKMGCRLFKTGAAFLISPVIMAIFALGAAAQTPDLQYSGLVVQVDLAGHQVVVNDPQAGSRIRFTVTETTMITSGTDKKSLGDIKPDDSVEIGYVQVGDQYIADTIAINPGG